MEHELAILIGTAQRLRWQYRDLVSAWGHLVDAGEHDLADLVRVKKIEKRDAWRAANEALPVHHRLND